MYLLVEVVSFVYILFKMLCFRKEYSKLAVLLSKYNGGIKQLDIRVWRDSCYC